MMKIDLWTNIPLETVNIPKTSDTRISNIYLYQSVPVYYLGMCDSEAIMSSNFASISSGLMPNIELKYIDTKFHQTGEIHLFMSYSRGFQKNLFFAMVHKMIACFHKHLAPQLWRLVQWKDHTFQIGPLISSQSKCWPSTFKGKWDIWDIPEI